MKRLTQAELGNMLTHGQAAAAQMPARDALWPAGGLASELLARAVKPHRGLVPAQQRSERPKAPFTGRFLRQKMIETMKLYCT